MSGDISPEPGRCRALRAGLSKCTNVTKTVDALSERVGVCAAALVVPLALIMTYEALARFLFNLPTFWAYELSYMLTGVHFALGMALVTLRNAHVRIDFIYARLPTRVRDAFDFLLLLCAVLPVAAWIAWGWVGYAADAYLLKERSGESGWNPLIWPVRFAIAAGIVLFALQLLSETVRLGNRILRRTH